MMGVKIGHCPKCGVVVEVDFQSDSGSLLLKGCEVESEQMEKVTVVGPMELSREVMKKMHDSGFRIMRSGPYTDLDMHPKCDMTRFLFIAERVV